MRAVGRVAVQAATQVSCILLQYFIFGLQNLGDEKIQEHDFGGLVLGWIEDDVSSNICFAVCFLDTNEMRYERKDQAHQGVPPVN